MPAPATTTAFGDTPDAPLFYAKTLISFMSAAWLAEDQFQREGLAGSKSTEFAALMPRVHADVLEIIGGLITVAGELDAVERYGSKEAGVQP
ncbi:hypothetical protein [Sphingobium yanoikuyae]|uniref:hypothetical protein n=1 Tax=Sphingobium yanoikuyae TaxID=13690 RepID=UPI000262C877|nr:hypothetical protein [Sphingobium yanoikuyae]